MTKGKSVFHLMALQRKVALAKKNQAVKTLQDELTKTTDIRDQLADLADSMNVPVGETTIGNLRSSSWYGNQAQEQLKTISNRTEFLSEEVETHRRDVAVTRHQHNRAVEKSEEHDQAERERREERAESLMPARSHRPIV
jgi:PHD/YefM family antitoxin component YafN of YafNO toxin-antitoxin module